mgnify:CR=1 FL=1
MLIISRRISHKPACRQTGTQRSQSIFLSVFGGFVGYRLRQNKLTIVMWYSFLNIFFFIFHTAFTLFNIIGWIFPKTRKLHLITMLLTACSWFILGAWYGWGYCLCTDWHWKIREAMGIYDRSDSYIHFLLLKVTGINFDPQFVETATLVIFLLCFVLNVLLTYNTGQKKKDRTKS